MIFLDYNPKLSMIFWISAISDIKAEVHDVAVLNHVVLTFDPEAAGLAHGVFTSERDVVVVLYNLGTYEALLEVGVYYAGAARSLAAAYESPGAHFVGACGKERLEVKQSIRRTDKARYTAFLQTYALQKLTALLVGVEFGNLAFGLRGDNHQRRALCGNGLAHGIDIGIAVHGRCVVDVAHVQDRLGRQQEKLADEA